MISHQSKAKSPYTSLWGQWSCPHFYYSPSHSFHFSHTGALAFPQTYWMFCCLRTFTLMFLLLETFFLVSSLLLPHLLPVFVQWHLNESFLIHLIANCTSNPTMMIYSSPLPSFIFRHSTNKLTYYMYLLIWFFSYLFLPQIEWTGVFMFAHCWLKCLKSTWHTTDTQLVQNKWMNGSFTNHHHNPLPPFSYLRVPLPL